MSKRRPETRLSAKTNKRLCQQEKPNLSCNICLSNFEALFYNAGKKLLDSPEVTDILYQCESCGESLTCYRCVIGLLEGSPYRNIRSIGFKCPLCRFYCCNNINLCNMDSLITSDLTSHELPSPKGFSTVAPNSVKGIKLPTSNATLDNTDHEDNMNISGAVVDLLRNYYDIIHDDVAAELPSDTAIQISASDALPIGDAPIDRVRRRLIPMVQALGRLSTVFPLLPILQDINDGGGGENEGGGNTEEEEEEDVGEDEVGVMEGV